MSQQQPTFFATQIAQQGQPPQQQPKTAQEVPLSPEKSLEQNEEDQCSLRQLLAAFNSFDKEEKGLIQLQNVNEIFSTRSVPTENIKQYHLMSLPLFEEMVSFDEFLFIFCLSENTSDRIQDKYMVCKTVDDRLIDFLKLLNKYRKKTQKNGNYKQAKNSRNKIQQIRKRELQRRNKYLKILYENQILETEQLQKQKFEELCSRWDHFMNQYELTASELVNKVKDRQINELEEVQERIRKELAPKIHYSKYILELQHKERNLVKLQQYEKAREIQQEIEDLKTKEYRQKELADEDTIQLRLKTVRKQQQSSINTLLQKIQKDRNEHMKQRQTQTQKLMIRNKAQLNQIDHHFNETIKKIHQALHNLGLQSQKTIKPQRN